MRNVFKVGLYLLIIVVTSSCATSGLRLADSEQEWHSKRPSNDRIVHSVYLIGDAGGAKMDESTLPLLELKKQLAADNREDAQTDVVFLGDNIYPVGMPPPGHKKWKIAAHRLDVQLEAVRAFEGNVTFVPGNHDWYKYGRDGLKRQEEHIESYLNKYNEKAGDYFRPSDGCGDIEVVKVTNDIYLMTIDSHWFLTNKPKEYDFSDCKVKNRKEFIEAFRTQLLGLKDKKVLLAMHHPFFTTGKHGGYYPLSSILFPLSDLNRNLIIPLPITGIVVSMMKPKITEQDTESKQYALYRNTLIPIIKEHGETIVAAGHEHTLQYHLLEGVHYIVSGSGSKKGPLSTDAYTKFAYGNYGYAIIDYYENGTTWLSFYASEEKSKTFREVYRAELN